MDSLELNDVCRICIVGKTMLNWNEEMFELCDLTYKDCYYIYTELPENDHLPTNICEECVNGLKNSHLLFKKALESFKILQSTFKRTHILDAEVYNNQPEIQIEIQEAGDSIYEIDSAPEDNAQIDIEEELHLTNVHDEVILTDIESVVENYEDLLKIEDGAIEPVSLKDTSFKEKDSESCVAKSTSLCKTYKTKGESPTETLTQQKYKDSYNVKISIQSTNKTVRKKKKNILICAYCSLKVDGNHQLKVHEATHRKDRERTETCPQCGIKLYTKMSLNLHMKIHDKNRQKNYKCEFCENAFFSRGALNVHRRIHLGLMVTCRICSKEFYRQIDLDRHLLNHSASPLEKRVLKKKYTVQCQQCNEYIPTTKWREHKAAHLNEPEVKCKICDKNFFARSKCVKHLQRLHRMKKGYEDYIHYFVVSNTRMSHLIMEQQEIVKSLID